MYLHEEMEAMDKKFYHMAGVLPGRAYRTPRLNRFGYVTLIQNHSVLGCETLGEIPAHEFHYFDSENCRESISCSKTGKYEKLGVYSWHRNYAGWDFHIFIIMEIQKLQRLFLKNA